MRKIFTQIVIERTEVYVVRRRRRLIRTFCEDCDREVSLVPPAKAALLTFREPSAIYSLVAENRVHFRFVAKGKKTFICLPSLCLI